jgi:hypothetical protein
MSVYHTVKIKKYVDNISEYTANAAITPGNLVELMSTGKIRKHSTAGAPAAKIFAIEDELQGKGIDTDYSAGSVVQCWWTVPGEEVYALLADSQNIAIGDFLVSDGAGRLTKCLDVSAKGTGAPEDIIGVALQAVNLSAEEDSESSAKGSYYPRIRIRIC